MRRKGFTLLETVVALAVTVLVLTALYGALGRAATARTRATERAERMAASRTLLLRIAHEVEAAVGSSAPASPERFVVVAPGPGEPPWAELRFATADAMLVAYRVAAGEDRTGTLLRTATSRFTPADSGTPAAVAVLPRVVGFRVRCFDGAEWRTAWTVPGLPRAVELAFAVDDGAGGTDELGTTIVVPASTA